MIYDGHGIPEMPHWMIPFAIAAFFVVFGLVVGWADQRVADRIRWGRWR
jgi:hypothetical protein